VASLSQGRTAAAQCGLFTRKSIPVIFEPPCIHSHYIPFTKYQENTSRIFELTEILQAFYVDTKTYWKKKE